MAQTSTAITKRAEQYLEAIQSFLQDLHILVEDWDTMEDGPKTSFSLEWDHLILDYLPMIDTYVKEKQLTARQIKLYQEILAQLTELIPTIDSMGLTRPTISRRVI